ncbi:protein crumbs-like [Ornithodoros turicata]|uniref:protein crumbs-like n=1 Tax=Ornithodoros turicata TaxID=34597 RepID=UPI0031387842
MSGLAYSLLSSVLLALTLRLPEPASGQSQSEGYFDGTSYAILNGSISFTSPVTLAFRTCRHGVLLFQSDSSGDSVAFSVLPSGVFELRWSIRSREDSVHIGANHRDNRWHSVALFRRLGALQLRVDRKTVLVASRTFRSYLLNVTLPSDRVWVGSNFTGCIQEGASVVLSGADVQSSGVRWGSCLLPDLGHCDGYDSDPCFSHVCQHSGVCTLVGGKPKCLCMSRYNGEYCQHDTGSLCNRPDHPQCQNGGTCQEDHLGNSTSCSCLPKYMGPLCETFFENIHCDPNPCQNGGSCVSNHQTRSYSCNCPSGFAGLRCELNINECQSSPCKNNGSCTDEVDGYSCDCHGTGYTGHNCETNINECAQQNPCFGASVCFDRYGGYECICEQGYEGINCDQKINECVSQPCMNGGTCVEGLGQHICRCPVGFSGANCEVNIDDCEGVACPRNSECVDSVNQHRCICSPGYIGSPPQCLRATNCALNPCKNGAKCEQNLNEGYTCVCMQGFSGDHCENNVDECASSPCLNGATCTDERGHYLCHCLPGYSGVHCEVDDNECASGPCLHGANCTDLVSDYLCTCPMGWDGKRCEKNVDDCVLQPCYHGHCVDGVGRFTCDCTPGYTGRLCESNIDDCDPNPCLNGGRCVDGLRDYHCECGSLFMGHNCEEQFDACHSGPCQNGATCSSLKPSANFTCSCPPGFTGATCETNINECDGVTCAPKFTCVDLINGYECRCPPGFTGSDCSTEVNECASNPCMNGTCLDDPSGYRCVCHPGYTGERCDRDVDECENEVCKFGSLCQNTVGSYQCFCRPGYTGTNCHIEVNECLSQPCQNGGTCKEGVNHYHCLCTPGYTGVNCEEDIDECASQPCMNGATCVDAVNQYKCICQPGYTGVQCETDIDECESVPCLNSGACIDLVNGYHCNCSNTGFTGSHCEHNINDCEPNPCTHGSTCRDGVKDFTCLCHPGYEGKTCHIDIPECDDSPCQNGAPCFERSNSSLYQVNHLGLFPRFSYETAGGYVCVCPTGFNGTDCENNIDDCAGNDCHHGDCVDLINAYRCDCHPGYERADCSHEINECYRYKPCHNGAVCFDKVADYECDCPADYGDKNCTTLLLGCRSSQCQNGAKCEPYLNDMGQHRYRCHCEPGYFGTHCDITTTVSFVESSFWNVSYAQEARLDHELKLRFRTTLRSVRLATLHLSGGSTVVLTLQHGVLILYVKRGSGLQSLLSVGETLNDSEWKDVTLKLSPRVAHLNVSGEHRTVDYTHPGFEITVLSVTFGRSGDVEDLPAGYVGCIQDVSLNGVLMVPGEQMASQQDVTEGCPREEQCVPSSCSNTGQCIDKWHYYVCQCSRPYYGERCSKSYPAATYGHQKSISWTKLSVRKMHQEMLRQSLNISFFFRTRKETGLLFYLGTDPSQNSVPLSWDGRESYSFVAALIESHAIKVILKVNTATSPVLVEVPGTFNDGELHFVQVTRNLSELHVLVDNSMKKNRVPDGDLTAEVMYLGWIPMHNPTRKKRQTTSILSGHVADSFGNVAHFKGVLQDFRMSGRHVNLLTDIGNATDDAMYSGPEVAVPVESHDVLNGIQSDNDCLSGPCMNGGTCKDLWNKYMCECTPEYRGEHCSDLKPCAENHCPDESACRDLENGYECVAPAAFSGNDSSTFHYKASLQTNTTIDKITFQYRSRTPGTILYLSDGEQTFSVGLTHSHLTVTWILDEFLPAPKLLQFGENVVDGNWHSVEIIISNSSVKARLQGQDYKETEEFSTASVKDLVTGGATYLGSAPNGSESFKGCMNDVRLGDILLPFFLPEKLDNSKELDRFELLGENEPRLGCILCWNEDCHNGGQCANETDSYLCSCPSTFEGDYCENDLDECLEDDKCLNGGECVNLVGSFECHCHLGFTGTQCGDRIYYCDASPCENSATCQDNDPGNYSCSCTEEFEGQNCTERKIISCAQQPCQNGRPCYEREPLGRIAYECDCGLAYEGLNCEHEKDFCKSQPCQNGANCSSTALEATYKCDCALGYRGRTCGEIIDYCEDLQEACKNGGRCESYVGGYECDCVGTGYQGPYCDVDINECEDSPCLNNGSCANLEGSYECSCVAEFFGRDCHLNNTCFYEQPCANGAHCTPLQDAERPFYCNCTIGYYGVTCALQVSGAALESTDLGLIIGLTVACVFLLAFIVMATVFLRVAKKKRATRGTYSPSNQEMFGSRVEMNPVMKPPPEERLI